MMMRLWIAFLFLPLFSIGQTFVGTEVVNKNQKYEVELKINPDSTFIFVRTLIFYKSFFYDHYGMHYKKEFNAKLYRDTISYFNGKEKRLDDTTFRLPIDDTYALSFFSEYYETDLACLGYKKDSMLIRYDSIRFNVQTKFRLIYEDGFDTTYQLKTLEQPCFYDVHERYNHHGICDTCNYSWICSEFVFPINSAHYGKSKSVSIDIGLKHPSTGKPILFKVSDGQYPMFHNWDTRISDMQLIVKGDLVYLRTEYGDIEMTKKNP